MYAFVEASVNEVYGFMGLAIILISLLLYFALDSWRLAATSLVLSIATILTTLGVGGWAGLVLSTGSAALATVILTLTTAMAMHYFMHIVRVLSDDQTRDQRQIAYGAAEAQLVPILLTGATTVVAMLSMLLVESPPFRDLGLWTAVSIPICCLYLFSVVPMVVQRIPKISPSRWQIGLQPVLNRYARGAGKSGPVAIVFGILALVAATNISQLHLDDDFVRYFDSDTRFRSDAEHVAENLIGPTNIEIEIFSGGSIYEPDFLFRTSSFAEELRSFPDIDNVHSIVDVLNFFGPHLVNQDWRQLDEDGIAQLLLVYELSLTDGQSKNDLISIDNSSIRVSVAAKDMSSRQIALLSERTSQLAERHSLNVLVTGEAIPLSYLSEKNIPNIALSLLVSIFGTSAFLAVFFRNLWLGGILFVTTVVPIFCGFGVWALFQDSIGIAATIVLCICTGVVIDDTIHMIYRFNHGRVKLGLDVQEAISYMVHRVGNAICTTTLILATGFGVLAFSPFEVNSTFGACTALILVGALAIDLIVLPNMLSFALEKEQMSVGQSKSGPTCGL
jgi:predicted RND superfamily exporter protein